MAGRFIAFMAPFVFFVIFQIRRRSIEDLLTTTMGLLKSLITAAVFQVSRTVNPSTSDILFRNSRFG